MPRLYRQDREDAEAADIVLHDLHRRDGGAHQNAGRDRSARRCVRVPADQSPARLPCVRQRRRMPASGFLVRVRPRTQPHGISAARVRRRRRRGRHRFWPHADAQPQPVHPVYSLRAVHARRGRRRADRHHRSRRRERNRHLQRRGRAFAALGQPDGRVPGGGHHHARLSLQVAAVGQPAGCRHHLHVLLEGLQHHGVDQGEARVGEGSVDGARDAALQP